MPSSSKINSFKPVLLVALLLGLCRDGHSNERDRLYHSYRSGQISNSAKAYLRVAERKGAGPAALLDAAAALREAGKTNQALALVIKALREDPKNADLLTEAAWLDFHEGRWEMARSRFAAALAANGRHPRALLGSGASLLKLKRPRKALRPLRKLIRAQPDWAIAHHFLGLAEAASGKPKAAVKSLSGALSRDYTLTESRMALGRLHLKEGRSEEAWAQYVKVLRVNTSHKLARRLKRRIEPKLKRSPAEILKEKKIARHTPVNPVAKSERVPRLRVGLGVRGMGSSTHWKTVRIRASGPFKVVGTRTGKIYARGKAGETWRVQVMKKHRGRSELLFPDGRKRGAFKFAIRFVPDDALRGTLIIGGDTVEDGGWAGRTEREYRGTIEVHPQRKGLILTNEVNAEEYVMGVLPSEVPTWWPLGALRVQSVMARTQLFYRKKYSRPHRKQPFHLCDSQHCQVYKGVSAETPRTNQVVIESRGEVVKAKGRRGDYKRYAHTLFHSTCGGMIQASKEVPGWGYVEYLAGLVDGPVSLKAPHSPWELFQWIKGSPRAYCRAPEYSKYSAYRWTRVIPHKVLEQRLNKRYRIGRLKKIVPIQRSRSGNVNKLLIVGSRRTFSVGREHRIRNALGLRSTLFFIETSRDAKGRILEYWVHGGGWGHGVGLCQTGAASMAGRHGKSYKEILGFYFPATKVMRLVY